MGGFNMKMLELTGTLFQGRTTDNDVFDVCDSPDKTDIDFSGASYSFPEEDKKTAGKPYIRTEGEDFFRVSDEEFDELFETISSGGEGSFLSHLKKKGFSVSFETPEKWTGKWRWARNIQLLP